jgi:hypothetical protein
MPRSDAGIGMLSSAAGISPSGASTEGTSMTNAPETGQDQPDVDADRQADAMKDQLRKDVASWAASRSGETGDLAKAVVPATRPQAAPTVRATRQRARPVEAATPVVVEKKPFKMSYDGTTDKDYIAQRIKLGAR